MTNVTYDATKSGSTIKSILLKILGLYVLLTLILGLLYPLGTTYIASITFPHKATGSLILDADNKVRGSYLLGQDFSSDTRYFMSRPSYANYEGAASGGFNLGPSSLKLYDLVTTRSDLIVDKYKVSHSIPTDMLTASASGLDRHISLKSAYMQAMYIAKINDLDEKTIFSLIKKNIDKQFMHSIDIVNVVSLNKDLYDILQKKL